MSGIDGPGPVGPAPPVQLRRLSRRPGSDFSVADDGAAVSAANPATAPAGMIALQEIDDTAQREAARHGRRILSALASLQRELLVGGATAATIAELQTLLATLPESDDPALKFALQAVALRARIELARRSAPSP